MKELTVQPVHSIGEHIGFELGAKLVKDYFDAYPDQAYGHIVGKGIIEKILAQPGCEGITIFPGLNEQGERTLVLAGVDKKGDPIVKIPVITSSGSIESEEGLIVDRIRLADGSGGSSGW